MRELSTSPTQSSVEPPLSWKTALTAGVAGLVVATIVNAIAFLLIDAAGMIPDDVTIDTMGGGESAIGLSTVVIMTLNVMVFAIIIYLLLARFTTRPRRIFLVVSAVVCLLSLVTPATMIDGAPAKMVVGLDIMHVLAAASGAGTMLLLSDPDRSRR